MSFVLAGLLIVVGVLCFLLLIKLKTTQDALVKSLPFQELVEEATVFVYTTDPVGHFTYINPAAATKLGVAAGQLIGQHFGLFIAPAYQARMATLYKRQIEERQSETQYQFPVVTKAGEEIWLEQISKLVLDSSGQPLCVRAMSRDITSTREQISALQEQKRHVQEGLAAAHAVHTALIPATLPEVPGLDIGLTFRPADELGGDYIEFLPSLHDKHFGVLFADITGHGLASALLSSMLKVLVSEVRAATQEQEAMMLQLNARIHKEFPAGKFASTALLEVDMQERSLHYVKASQEPILHHRPGEGVTLIEAGGPALGLVSPTILGKRMPFASQHLQLHPGDTLILYTDGLIEMENAREEQIGRMTLLKWIEDEAHRPAQEMADALFQRALDTAGRTCAEDDVTVLVVRVK